LKFEGFQKFKHHPFLGREVDIGFEDYVIIIIFSFLLETYVRIVDVI
jgi:hypothetical protein